MKVAAMMDRFPWSQSCCNTALPLRLTQASLEWLHSTASFPWQAGSRLIALPGLPDFAISEDPLSSPNLGQDKIRLVAPTRRDQFAIEENDSKPTEVDEAGTPMVSLMNIQNLTLHPLARRFHPHQCPVIHKFGQGCLTRHCWTRHQHL